MNKPQKMLLGIAIGDAFGAGYEFAYKTRQEYKDKPLIFKAHPNKEFNHKPGMYTDDTQMSIAVSLILISDKEFNKENLADSFVELYKLDPIIGYSKGFQGLLNSINTGEELLKNIRNNSIRNGAAMRSLPLGIIKNIEEVKKYATINAKITHDTPKGIDSSVAIAMLSHHLFYDKKIPKISKITPHLKDLETINYLQKLESSNFDLEHLLGKENLNTGIPCDGMRTTGAVFYLLKKYDTGVDILREAINLGGDTDSVASISLGAYLINNELDLPSNLTKNLTNHKFGRDFLLDVGDKLNQKYIL